MVANSLSGKLLAISKAPLPEQMLNEQASFNKRQIHSPNSQIS